MRPGAEVRLRGAILCSLTAFVCGSCSKGVDCKFSFLVQREKWTRWICVVTNYLNGCWIGYLLPRADGRGEIGRPWNQCGTPEEPATVEELCR